eukprot:8559072-Pyramimonas_sp.AAC.1
MQDERDDPTQKQKYTLRNIGLRTREQRAPTSSRSREKAPRAGRSSSRGCDVLGSPRLLSNMTKAVFRSWTATGTRAPDARLRRGIVALGKRAKRGGGGSRRRP